MESESLSKKLKERREHSNKNEIEDKDMLSSEEFNLEDDANLFN